MNHYTIFIWLVGTVLPLQVNDLQEVRRLYFRSPVSKADARQLDKLMADVNDRSAPLFCCYKGANEMVQAKYAVNPLIKLEKFNRGKALINSAVGEDTLSLEMRFIRFTVQSNLPGFLDYSGDIGRDKRYITRSLQNCPDTGLKKMITVYLAQQAFKQANAKN